MRIQEILEAHYDAAWNYQGRRECACGHEFTAGYSAPIHRAHVAQVLEQHEREANAAVLEEAAAELNRLDGGEAEMYNEDLNATPVTFWLRNRAAQLKENI